MESLWHSALLKNPMVNRNDPQLNRWRKSISIMEHSASEVVQSHSRFDFRASWPSGLLVEPVGDDRSEYPFYILQKYISKGPECGPVSRENYRKFLRNGTVLKFFDDGMVEVLRPNGTIVRCLNFEKTTRSSYSEHGRDGNLTKGKPLEIDRRLREHLIHQDTPDYGAHRYIFGFSKVRRPHKLNSNTACTPLWY